MACLCILFGLIMLGLWFIEKDGIAVIGYGIWIGAFVSLWKRRKYNYLQTLEHGVGGVIVVRFKIRTYLTIAYIKLGENGEFSHFFLASKSNQFRGIQLVSQHSCGRIGRSGYLGPYEYMLISLSSLSYYCHCHLYHLNCFGHPQCIILIQHNIKNQCNYQISRCPIYIPVQLDPFHDQPTNINHG